MASGYTIRKNAYYDSIFLMGVNKRLSQTPGVEQTAVLMATEANKQVLEEIGIAGPDIEASRPNDLIVAVTAVSGEIVKAVIAGLDHVLKAATTGMRTSGVRTLNGALQRKPNANLAVVSIPGEYVMYEARRALDAGLHVFIFSSNVPLAQELELKSIGVERNLLVMGPDCGTSILNGIGIGFANRVRRGMVGVVGPSGTGLQEFTSQVHNAGGGISHAIGTGSRDLSDEIGGLTTLQALQILDKDADTKVIAIIAKPPGEQTLITLSERAKSFTKPVIGCFLGVKDVNELQAGSIQMARTIDEAVLLALQSIGSKPDMIDDVRSESEGEQLNAIRAGWSREARNLRGLFAGGTFCYQSQQILSDAGFIVYSNSPINPEYGLPDPDTSRGHTLIDLGDEHFTLGTPHPMIDSTKRALRILAEADDPSVAILLLDFILGYNAARDPVGDLLGVLQQAQALRRETGSELTIVASVCGTKEDPQNFELQTKMLREIGVHLFGSNAQATRFCLMLLAGSECGS
jgi:succinyl-CoA synthetase alpha subunit